MTLLFIGWMSLFQWGIRRLPLPCRRKSDLPRRLSAEMGQPPYVS
jgi:hypothetical protein